MPIIISILEANFQSACDGALKYSINDEIKMIVIFECMGSKQKFCK